MAEAKGTPKIFVATPMYGGMCAAVYVQSLLDLVFAFVEKGVQWQLATIANESLIPRARNAFASAFLSTDCSHLLFIDADIGFAPAAVFDMLAADRDIVCCLAPRKVLDWERIREAAINGASGLELARAGASCVYLGEQPRTLREIRFGGTGLMLIKRAVLETLKEIVPAYANDCLQQADQSALWAPMEGRADDPLWDFFPAGVLDGQYLSEDYGFCEIARRQGFKVFALPARLVHVGTHIFYG
ncbi:hypothetical protein FBR04_19395 [Betaproteobacteria bacterium PRO7]|nr:hypothetical protein [Betaproteobacteria bacterium PRO7]